jgi:DNA-binding NarL/FixJ family response regulator
MSSAPQIDVLLVDDHENTRAGLITMLAGTHARILGEAATASDEPLAPTLQEFAGQISQW